ALNHFAQLADESDEVPNLKGKSYSDFYLRKRDWEKLELMHEVLKVWIENLDKWYNKVNDTDAYFICLFLDPNIKNAYALDKWDAKSYTAGMAQLEKVVRAAL
ncbi:hypothetical protein BYT27DRAFT_7105690, partial [Phlegmacium glaucopus]